MKFVFHGDYMSSLYSVYSLILNAKSIKIQAQLDDGLFHILCAGL